MNKEEIKKIKQKAEAALLSNVALKVNNKGIPCFIEVDGENAYRKDEDPGERQAITAIVKHGKDDKYLMLKWIKIDWTTFITGGIENGQTAEEVARAEILEETGYKNLKLIRELSRVDAKFYHTPKKTNRTAQFTNFYFELEDEEQAMIDESEKSKHEALWVTKGDVEKLLVSSGMKYIWRDAVDGV